MSRKFRSVPFTRSVWAVEDMRRFFMICLMFYVNGVDVFHVIIFYLIHFLFNSCFKLAFDRFNFSANSIVVAHLFNMLLKRCDSFRKILSFSMTFDEYLFVVCFSSFVSSERSSVSDLRLTGSFPIFFGFNVF